MARVMSKIIVSMVGVFVVLDASMIFAKVYKESSSHPTMAPNAVHTTAWYIAHPDIAKEDEARCGNNAQAMSPAACQNDASAENELLSIELGKAAEENTALSSAKNAK